MDQAFYETVAREEEYMSSLKSVSEYAKEVGKPERTIRQQCIDNKLLAFKIGNQWAVVGPKLKGEK
jgi:hypothetical protein